MFKDCSIVDGHLEIQMRSISKNPELGSNIVKELETNLANIVEITDYLKIARSHSILSLSFLKNLKKIHGKKLDHQGYIMNVWENQNLQELFAENQTIEFGREKPQFLFHYNPKLCFYKIADLAMTTSKEDWRNLTYQERQDRRIDWLNRTIVNYEMAKMANGDRATCNVTQLNITNLVIYEEAAALTWTVLKLDDQRSLLNYVIYWIAAPDNKNISLWDGRNACGRDDWNVEDVNTNFTNDTITWPITKLEAFTRYAFYVKAFTLATEMGAQSNIEYFTTKPGRPGKIKLPKLTALSYDSIVSFYNFLKNFD
jgi:insulin receptor